MPMTRVEVDSDGIALITIDVPASPVNSMSDALEAELLGAIERVRDDASIQGAVIVSGKSTGFCAGRDLAALTELASTFVGARTQLLRAAYDHFHRKQHMFRALETCGKPISCVLQGAVSGAGVELALACHYRVAESGAGLQIRFADHGVGMMPCGGATQRLPRLIGIKAALSLLLDGKSIDAAEALKIRLVNEVASPGEAYACAQRWVKAAAVREQPWDRKDFVVPGGGPYAPSTADAVGVATALARKSGYGNVPATRAILCAVYEGTQVPIDAALRIESRYFVSVVTSSVARAMTRSLLTTPQQLARGANRPGQFARSDPKKVTVVGAGLMGAGIALVQATVGIDTVLIDVSDEAAQKGKSQIAKILAKQVGRGQLSQSDADAILQRILATSDYAHVAGSDLVIEAVFEDRHVKTEVTRKCEALLGPHAIFASNTSTLPITELAHASQRPANFIGLHFFSPVERMALVEIIRGKQTSDETLAKSFDYVAKLRKTPIVVNDSRGFYTSRTFTTYLDEPCEMLLEGVAPAIIENIGRMIGMPLGPFEIADEVGLDLAWHVKSLAKAELGSTYVGSAADIVLPFIVETHGRKGRKSSHGFYDYSADGKTKRLWSGLTELRAIKLTDAFDRGVQQDLRDRLLFRMALEMARCMEEGVLSDPREADSGALLGFAFPAWTGGPATLIDSIGVANFVARCDEFVKRHGVRFAPPQLLRRLARDGKNFYS